MSIEYRPEDSAPEDCIRIDKNIYLDSKGMHHIMSDDGKRVIGSCRDEQKARGILEYVRGLERDRAAKQRAAEAEYARQCQLQGKKPGE